MTDKLGNLEDLYKEQLQDLYSAEKQITEALPKMESAAQSNDLKQAFREHGEVTRKQISRLERIFEDFGERPGQKKCKGMEGLIKEGEELIQMKSSSDRDAMDAGLIAAAQRVEHYEIAAYGSARTYAERLGKDEHARLLQQTLDEEGQTDKKLTRLAESHINREARR